MTQQSMTRSPPNLYEPVSGVIQNDLFRSGIQAHLTTGEEEVDYFDSKTTAPVSAEFGAREKIDTIGHMKIVGDEWSLEYISYRNAAI